MLHALRRLIEGTTTGDSLYLRGLKDAHAGAHKRALVLFEEAAQRYRREESVEKLARLRAHQLMVKYTTEKGATEKQRIIEEVVLRLSKLKEIESPEPPFAPLDAKQVLRKWMEEKTLFIGAGTLENGVGIEEEAILAELDPAMPCELIGAVMLEEELRTKERCKV